MTKEILGLYVFPFSFLCTVQDGIFDPADVAVALRNIVATLEGVDPRYFSGECTCHESARGSHLQETLPPSSILQVARSASRML